MGSSTGNLLVDRPEVLETLFGINGREILVHSEDERTIRENLEKALEQFGEDIPIRFHSSIRSRRACLVSTIAALEMAIAKGTRLHLLHVSTKEEAEMIRAAKIHNPGITSETSANYLWFCEDDYDRLGSRLKCNPAVKTAADREALIEGLADGTIDAIATDHAPHTAEEKSRGLQGSAMGIVGLETAFPVLYTSLVKTGRISLERLVEALTEGPRRAFRLDGGLAVGQAADLTVIDPEAEYTIDPSHFLSKGRSTPFEGMPVRGRILMTLKDGHIVYEYNS
jgi:dihydroorotase